MIVSLSPFERGRRDSQRAGAAGEGLKFMQILRPAPSLKASPCQPRASRLLPEGEGELPQNSRRSANCTTLGLPESVPFRFPKSGLFGTRELGVVVNGAPNVETGNPVN